MLFSLFLLLAHLLFFWVLRLRSRFVRCPKSIAFFHPYCNGGGGGERVLWRAVSALQNAFNDWTIVVYTDDVEDSDENIIENAKLLFDIEVNAKNVKFVRLSCCSLIQPIHFFTIFVQLFGGLWLALEALWYFTPTIFIDSTGVPLSLPVFKFLGGSKTLCYVHYPTITNDMIEVVRKQNATYNNASWIARCYYATLGKTVYYYDLTLLYSFCISKCTDLIMANGSWTNEHLREVCNLKSSAFSPVTIFPPCDVHSLYDEPKPPVKSIGDTDEEDSSEDDSSEEDNSDEDSSGEDSSGEDSDEDKENRDVKVEEAEEVLEEENGAERLLEEENTVYVLSIGQFRPEKDHFLQLNAFAEARRILDELTKGQIKMILIMAGGCRDDEDYARADNIRTQARNLYGFEDEQDIRFRLNVSFAKLRILLQSSLIGIHTMRNEHFGISVVESLAAGNIMIAHNSGGPKMDIIGGYAPPKGSDDAVCGFLASSTFEYADCITKIINKPREWRENVRAHARLSAERFNHANFDTRFVNTLRPIIESV